MRSFRLLLTLFSLFPALCLADLQGENLLQPQLHDYQIGFETTRGNMLMTEMIPKKQTVENWTEMVTTQIFLGDARLTPETFQAGINKLWKAACKNSTMTALSQGVDNGYSFTLWQQSCPFNTETKKPENTWFKAIRGNNHFYVIQKAFRFEPSEAQINELLKHLRATRVCDTRLDDRPCPRPI